MNYLTEIRLFYDWLEMNEGLTPSAITLWHGLMFIANKSGWKEELLIPTSMIILRTKLPRPSIYRVRKELVDAGLISVKSRGGRLASSYRIHSFELKFASKCDTQLDTQYDTQIDTQIAEYGGVVSQINTQCDTIYKPKQDINVHQKKQTKKKVVFSLDEWVADLVSPWRELMRIWMEYKRSRKEAYTSQMGANACLKKLQHLSGGSPELAQKIVEESMANNWAGLFPVKEASGARGHPTSPATGQRIGQIMQPESEEHRNSILQKFKDGVNK